MQRHTNAKGKGANNGTRTVQQLSVDPKTTQDAETDVEISDSVNTVDIGIQCCPITLDALQQWHQNCYVLVSLQEWHCNQNRRLQKFEFERMAPNSNTETSYVTVQSLSQSECERYCSLRKSC